MKSSSTNSIFIPDPEIEFSELDLALPKLSLFTRDVSFLNSFENVLTKKIV